MKKIIYDKHIELLDFIKSNVEKGYDIYSNTEDINELIDIIVNWYKFKYPEIVLEQIIEFTKSHKARLKLNTKNLFNSMGYFELMCRIPKKLHPIVECWYTEKSSSISLRNTCNIATITFDINRYDGYFENPNIPFMSQVSNINCSTLEELLNNIQVKKFGEEFDLDQIKKLVFTHNLNLELRNKIFNLIALKIFDSSPDLVVGYLRARLFIAEFNKYIYNLNLNKEEIDKIIDDVHKYLYPCEKFIEDYMIKVVEELKTGATVIYQSFPRVVSKDKKIDEYGLSFETLLRLSDFDIFTAKDVKEITQSKNMLTIKDFRNLDIPERDKKIILEIMNEETQKTNKEKKMLYKKKH